MGMIVATTQGKATSKADAQAAHEAILKKARGEADVRQDTGILLVFPQFIVHMIESTTKGHFTYLRELIASPEFKVAKVVSSTEDIPTRAYPKWLCAFVPLDGEGGSGLEDEALVNMGSEANLSMIKLG